MKTFKLSKFILFLISLTVLFTTDTFAGNKVAESFTSGAFPPSGWRTQHVSGVATSGAWFRSTSGYLSSPSCAQSDAGLFADNFLITKKFTPQAEDSLVFYVSSNYIAGVTGRLDVKVSFTDSLAASFIDLIIPLNINLELLTPNVYVRKAVGLSSYAGQSIYIAFRHIELAGVGGSVRLDGITIGGVDLNITTLMEVHRGVGFFPVPRRDRDTIVVSLRSIVSPYPVIDSKKVFLDTLGKKNINFSLGEEGINYYIVVEHRNSVRTWSAAGGVVFTGGVIDYDFSTNINRAYGSNEIYVNADACMYSGDINNDGYIDLSDILPIYNDGLIFVTGPYVLTDLNWDNYTDLQDIIICYNHNVEFTHELRP